MLTAGACSEAQPEPVRAVPAADQPSPLPPGESADEPADDPSGSPSAAGDDAPKPGSMDRPDTSSGPLSQDDFPRPKALGDGWAYSIDPGDAEDGYAGNGTPALARNPAEVVRLAVPLGCARPDAMPLPDHALEVDYTVGATKVIAVRGEFKDVGMAEVFFDARNANVQRCLGRSGGQAIGPLVSTAETLADGVLLSDRTPESAPWTELALLDGDQVVLVAAQTGLGTPPMTKDQARRLAEVFRR